MENMTKTGLLLLMMGFLIGIISNIILFFLPQDISGFIFLMIVGLVALVGGLLALIGGLLLIIGRKEIGEAHSKFAIYALIIFVVSIVASFVISIVVAIFLAPILSFYSAFYLMLIDFLLKETHRLSQVHQNNLDHYF